MKHQLRITDNTAKEQWDYTCSCGILIGWITQPASHPRIQMAAHQFIRAWEDHTTKQWIRQLGPRPEAVTIWIQPTQQWRAISWDLYMSGFVIVLKPLDDSSLRRLPDPDPNTTAFDFIHERLTIHPIPGHPLIWR